MIKHEYVDINGIKLHYAACGSGSLMIFLHGFPEFWYAWKDQLPEFGQDHLAVAPDMRGYNLSDKPTEVSAYQIPNLIADVRALAESLGYQKFTLIGHDWGGAVAWAFALTFPEYLERLIIVNAPHPITFYRELLQNPAQQAASQYMLMFRSAEAEAMLSANNFGLFQETFLNVLLAQGHLTAEDCQAYLTAWAQPGALTGGLNYYRAAEIGPPTGQGDQDKLQALLKMLPNQLINVPTLVIWGEQDIYLLASELDGLEEYVPNVTIERIPEGTHWVIHEYPTQVNNLIRAFLKQ